MKKVYIILTAFLLLGCNNANNSSTTTADNSNQVLTPTSNVVNVDNESDCLNYLKGKNFYGGDAKLDFLSDGSVSAYNKNSGALVFTGSVEIGERYGNASRKIEIQATDNSGTLKLLLSVDGKLMDQSDFTIYKPR